MPSMVYITGLSEMEAVLGEDEEDGERRGGRCRAIAPPVCGHSGDLDSHNDGDGFPGLAKMGGDQEQSSVHGFATTGMASYVKGVSMRWLRWPEGSVLLRWSKRGRTVG